MRRWAFLLVLLPSLAAWGQPKDPALLRQQGIAAFNAEKFRTSFILYREAISLAPTDASLRFELAGYMAAISEYEPAITVLGGALALEPENARGWALLATLHGYLKHPLESFQASRRAAELGDRREAFTLAWIYGGEQAQNFGVKPNPAQEKHWLEQAAEAGHIEAMQALAEFYAKGRPGFPPNEKRSREWRLRFEQAV